MRVLELKIPPPVVALVCALLMWAAARAMPLPALPAASRLPLALVLAVAGVGADLAGLLTFLRARTTINPLRPGGATSLVTSGIYRLTRNPMYVGLALQLLAWAAYLGAAAALPLVACFVLYVTRFQIVPEERILAGVFGAAYDEYRARVRRWL
jgi:protein-S-isoprenylcysteine O-methyltransferase Ste14